MFTGATSYSFVYGMEAVIQLKIEITSLRVLMESKLKKVEWVKIRYE
jgi:FlaG/FlaF family flagellin (archaellin)